MSATDASTGTETPADPAQGGSGPENGSQGPSAREVQSARVGHGATAPVVPGTTGTEPAEPTEGERDESGRYLSREQTRYRQRLRETEAERDTLRTQLDALQRAEVERLASQHGLAVPGDVWSFGADLEHLRTDDGHIDTDTVSGLVADIIKDRPGLGAPKVGDLGLGRGGAAAPSNGRKVGLSALLKPGQR